MATQTDGVIAQPTIPETMFNITKAIQTVISEQSA